MLDVLIGMNKELLSKRDINRITFFLLMNWSINIKKHISLGPMIKVDIRKYDTVKYSFV